MVVVVQIVVSIEVTATERVFVNLICVPLIFTQQMYYNYLISKMEKGINLSLVRISINSYEFVKFYVNNDST